MCWLGVALGSMAISYPPPTGGGWGTVISPILGRGHAHAAVVGGSVFIAYRLSG